MKTAWTICCLVLLVLSRAAIAQEITGNISGRVADHTGAVIPGVAVTLSGPAMQGQREAVTGENGSYQYLFVPPGIYTLTFELPGFKTLIREGIIVEVRRTTTINATLEVAAQAETVTVTGESPVVDVQNATVAVNFNRTLLRDLPNSRDMWQVLAEVPGLKVTFIDVGGSNAGNQASFRSYGMFGQVWMSHDGAIMVQGTQFGGFFPDYGAIQEVQVAAAANAAEVPTPGTFFNAVYKTGSNDLHGEVYLDWEHPSFQSENITPDLKRPCVAGQRGPCGLFTGDKLIRHNEFNANGGGPIRKDKLWWFISWREYLRRISTLLKKDDGSPGGGPFDSLKENRTLKMNYQINVNNTLTFFGQGARKFEPFRGGMGPNAGFFVESSTARGKYWGWVSKVQWTSVINPRTTLDVSANTSGFQQNADARESNEIPRRDLVTQVIRGAFSGTSPGLVQGFRDPPFFEHRRRWHFNGNVSYFKENFLGGNHNFKFGHALHWEDIRQTQKGPLGHVITYYRSGVPDQIDTYNSRFTGQDSLLWNSFFAQDKWQIGRKVTLNLGFRFDRYTSFYPKQGNPGTGPYAEKFSVEKKHLATFNTVVPRLAVVYDIRGNGKTALKLAFGRYSWNTSHEVATAANPNTTIVKRYRWDGRLPFDPSRAQLLDTRATVLRSVDPNLKNAYTDEYIAGIDQQLATDLSLRLQFVRKLEHDLYGGVNVAEDISRFTAVPFLDPGRDGLSGTSDDRTITVFNILPAFRGVSQEVVRNFKGVGSNYSTFEIEATKRLNRNWQFLTGGDWTKRNLNQILTLNPNDLLYGGTGRPDFPNSNAHYWEWTYKLHGIRELPYGFTFSGVYKAQKGEAYNRRLNVTGLNQGTITIAAEPLGSFFYPDLHLVDLRLQKRFQIKDRHRVDTIFDLFNLLNRNSTLGVNTLTGPNFNRQVTQIIDPRVFKVAVRYTF